MGKSGIAFDFDGVISDSYFIFRGHYFDMFGHNMEAEKDHHCFEMDIVHNPLFEDWWWKEIPVAIAQYQHIAPPIHESAEALKAFYDYYGEVVIITAREPSDAVMQVTKQWCDKVLDFPYEIFFVATSRDKKNAMMREGIKYYVDDRWYTCQMLSEILTISFLFDRPWNDISHRSEVLANNVIKVDSLWTMFENLKRMGVTGAATIGQT